MILAEKLPGTWVVVAMPHQNQACVRVCLAPVRSSKAEQRGAACRRNHSPKPRKVYVAKLVLRRPVQRPKVAQAVEVIEDTRAAPVFTQARRIQSVAVRQHRGAGRRAVANISIGAGAVRFAHPQAQAVVSVAVHKPARQSHRGHPVFVVVSVVVNAPIDGNARFVAVFIVGLFSFHLVAWTVSNRAVHQCRLG